MSLTGIKVPFLRTHFPKEGDALRTPWRRRGGIWRKLILHRTTSKKNRNEPSPSLSLIYTFSVNHLYRRSLPSSASPHPHIPRAERAFLNVSPSLSPKTGQTRAREQEWECIDHSNPQLGCVGSGVTGTRQRVGARASLHLLRSTACGEIATEDCFLWSKFALGCLSLGSQVAPALLQAVCSGEAQLAQCFPKEMKQQDFFGLHGGSCTWV